MLGYCFFMNKKVKYHTHHRYTIIVYTGSTLKYTQQKDKSRSLKLYLQNVWMDEKFISDSVALLTVITHNHFLSCD